MCGPVFDAVESVRAQAAEPPTLVMLSPQGEPLTQATLKELARHAAAHPECPATSAAKGTGIPELRAALATLAVPRARD